jgi:hypothetical protein
VKSKTKAALAPQLKRRIVKTKPRRTSRHHALRFKTTGISITRYTITSYAKDKGSRNKEKAPKEYTQKEVS